MIFSVFNKNLVFGYSWSTLLWYQCYYPHRSRDALSPACGIFSTHVSAQNVQAEFFDCANKFVFRKSACQWHTALDFAAQAYRSLSKHSPWFGGHHGIILKFWKTMKKWAKLCTSIPARVHKTKIIPKIRFIIILCLFLLLSGNFVNTWIFLNDLQKTSKKYFKNTVIVNRPSFRHISLDSS